MWISRLLPALVVPVGALVAARLVLPHLGELPPSLSGLKLYAPHIAIGIGLGVSLGFGRSRTFFSLIALALAYVAVHGYPGTALYHGATVALPLVFGLAAWGRESPLRSAQGVQRAAALAVIAAAIAALCTAFPVPIATLLSKAYVASWPIAPLGQVAIAANAIGLASAFGAWLHRREAAALALASAMIAFALAAGAVAAADASRIYVAAAALALAVAVLQDIFHMAFRDPLTGLLSRRALDEHLRSLGRRYAVAMVDVDHFKRVNDRHGHDTGDEVLRKIARALAQVPDARAYRYGGEEFTLLFPGRNTQDVLEHLEAVRERIASDPFRLRSTPRKMNGRRARNRATAGAASLKVTVSIGVAESDGANAAPASVIAKADKALYRAKDRGRNAVCR